MLSKQLENSFTQSDKNMKPDPSTYNPRPDYLRALVDRSGLSQRKVAYRIGVSDRLLRYYLAPRDSATFRVAPYPVQFALEVLSDT